MNEQKTWVEVNSDNLIHNISEFRKRVGESVKIAGVLKSNAYGHGLKEVALVIKEKVDWIAVDSVCEALELKRQGIDNEILILGYTLESNLTEVVKNGFHQVVANFETLKALEEICQKENTKAKVHLKIETGTSRQGIFLKDLQKYLELIKSSDFLELKGVSTHFANIEDTTDPTFAMSQLEKYKEALKVVDAIGFENYIRHTASSAAAVLFDSTHFDMIRLGISLYGMWSSKETQVSASQEKIGMELLPVLTWKTKIAHIKTLDSGACVSYGCTEKLTQKTKTAVLPIGYWDGYDRGLSSIGKVLVGGTLCRVLGRVCMNMIVIDVTQIKNVKLEDEVVLIGKQGSEVVSAETIASQINSINYEVTTRINPLIERRIVEKVTKKLANSRHSIGIQLSVENF